MTSLRLPLRSLALLLVCAASCDSEGCGGDRPSPQRARPDAASGGDARVDAEQPPPRGRAEGYRVLGVTAAGVLLYDETSERPGLQPVDLKGGWLASEAGRRRLESLCWLDGGEVIAARSKTEVALWRRTGELVGEAPLPDLCRDDRRRTIAYLTESLAEAVFAQPDLDPVAEAARRCDDLVRPGPLVVTPGGALAMDPFFAFGAVGTEDDCEAPNPELRLPLKIPGAEAPGAVTPSPWNDMSRGIGDLLGESCASISPYDGSREVSPSARRWFGEKHRALTTCLIGEEATVEGCLRHLGAEGDAPELEARDLRANEGLKLCRRPGSERLYLVEWLFDTGMGCLPRPGIWVIDGGRVVAETEAGLRIAALESGWIYGGRDRWYLEVEGDDGPRLLSRVKPAVVRVSGAGRREVVVAKRGVDGGRPDPWQSWHCLCYSKLDEAGRLQSETACRRERSRCEGLEQKARAQVGTYRILLRGCRPIRAAHPADALGGRSVWEPSAIEGAWWVPGRCLLR